MEDCNPDIDKFCSDFIETFEDFLSEVPDYLIRDATFMKIDLPDAIKNIASSGYRWGGKYLAMQIGIELAENRFVGGEGDSENKPGIIQTDINRDLKKIKKKIEKLQEAIDGNKFFRQAMVLYYNPVSFHTSEKPGIENHYPETPFYESLNDALDVIESERHELLEFNVNLRTDMSSMSRLWIDRLGQWCDALPAYKSMVAIVRLYGFNEVTEGRFSDVKRDFEVKPLPKSIRASDIKD